MNHRKSSRRLLYLCLVAGLVCHARTAGAGLYETLTQKLAEYCVPKDAGICEETGDIKHKASYENGKCRCPCEDQYYDAALRKCVDCDLGTPDRFATSCGPTSCSAGYKLVAGSSTNSCSPGYKLVTQERTCATGIGPSSCPAGYKYIVSL